MRLAKVSGEIIHPDQAGFVPNRQIMDQTSLVQMIIHYAEVYEVGGEIISLDQEKAYDKIAHDFLWRILKAFNIPDEFISSFKALYEHAETSVMINGLLGRPDPLSCLLFNLAAEPPAEAIRLSNLKGFQLKNLLEGIIAKLFADDTTVFLSVEDRFSKLMKIIDNWCAASRARYNGTKTEMTPVGTPAHREKVAQSRKLNDQSEELTENVKIADDGTAFRILGGWFGNEVDSAAPWEAVVGKIDSDLRR